MSGRFAVIGLGIFGTSLARHLSSLGAEVAAFDRLRERADALRDEVASAVILDASDEVALRAQGLEQMDAVVVAIGDDFEQVVLIVTVLQELKVRRIIARALRPLHRSILCRLGVTEVVSPNADTGERLARTLALAGSLENIPVAAGHALVKVAVPQGWSGRTLADLGFREKFRVNVVTVLDHPAAGSDKPSCLGVPRPDLALRPSHILVLFGAEDDIASLLRAGGS